VIAPFVTQTIVSMRYDLSKCIAKYRTNIEIHEIHSMYAKYIGGKAKY